jgi:flagellar hook-associated protein 1 FlgK
MSLFGSLQLAGNTLQAMQIGLHVVGNNIANANTPGFIRERTIYTPAPVQKLGRLTLGLGVEIAGIVQVIDKFTEGRLWDAGGDRASAEAQQDAYRTLETILSPLNDEASLTALTTNFFNAIHEITTAPETENAAVRDLAIESGKLLTQAINSLQRRVDVESQDLNTRVTQIADEVNTLSEEIRLLNLRIVTVEAGGATGSDAGALRSQRSTALQKLSELVDVTITETATGSTNVNLNGQILVFEATRREVQTGNELINDQSVAVLEFTENSGALEVTGGELHGVYQARDEILGGFLDGLDDFARALAFQFNKVYSQGQGINGFQSLTGTYQATDANAALNAAGLDFTPVNGKFELIVNNKSTPEADAKSHIINVDLDGLGNETSLNSLATAISQIDGITASVSIDNQLVINSDSADLEFAFEKDTSGVLAALGLNTFFAGNSASSLSVNSVLASGANPGLHFAASRDGIGAFNTNALELIQLQDQGLEDLDGGTILGVYNRLVNQTAQGGAIAGSIAEGLRTFEGSLDAEFQSVSGVNLDEEAIDMIQLQRTYQASARYIQTLSELLDVLVAL